MRWSRWTFGVAALLLTILSATAWADDEIDIDLWHQELADALGEEPE